MRSSLLVILVCFCLAFASATLLLDDPEIFAQTKQITSSTREVMSAHTLGFSKRATPTNFLKIGQLKATSGVSSGFSALQMHAWELFFSKDPYLVIGGQIWGKPILASSAFIKSVVGIQVLTYVDSPNPGDAPNTTAALSEWFVVHDKVPEIVWIHFPI
jgi:hypothetical protein